MDGGNTGFENNSAGSIEAVGVCLLDISDEDFDLLADLDERELDVDLDDELELDDRGVFDRRDERLVLLFLPDFLCFFFDIFFFEWGE